jgi:hypothetical protein
LTDANIDESCNRTHYGSNWVVCVGKYMPCAASDKSPAKIISSKEITRIDSGRHADERLVDQDDADATWMFDDRGLSWRPQAAGC